MDKIFTKDEFLILAMLYVANIDGHIHADEIDTIMNRFDAAAVAAMRKKFDKMNDIELLSVLNAQKDTILTSAEDKQKLLGYLREVIDADGRNTPMENFVYQEMERLMQ